MATVRILLSVLVAAAVVPGAVAQEGLKPVSPDESVEQTLRERFSVGSALESLTWLRGALDSFVALTEAAQDKVPAATLKQIGNTDWESQHLGFRNAPGAIEGTLRLQELEIRRLRWELALEGVRAGTVAETEAAAARQRYERADKEFCAFWESFGISD